MKGINFKEPLFYATIEGRKNQTRRIMNPQPVFSDNLFGIDGGSNPRYKVGEVVYLKEPYRYFEKNDRTELQYKFRGDVEFDEDGCEILGWANKLFMPASVARYFIRITAVLVESLQDISEADCMREGIVACSDPIGMPDGYHWVPGSNLQFATPRGAYAALIDKINGRMTWDSNPWVFVYDYELIER